MINSLPNPNHTNSRHGATLTEVLMSLLIMSIGIVSVFSLFPIAILSSIKATQLTSAKLSSDNVVELIRLYPTLLTPPCPSTLTDRGVWSPSTNYSINDCISPTTNTATRHPYLLYRCTLSEDISGGGPPFATPGQSGAFEPNWPSSGAIVDGGEVTWVPVTSGANFIVDPLGRHIDGVDSRTTFGNDSLGIPPGVLTRSSGGIASYPLAQSFFTLPDSWSVALEAVPTTMTGGNTITFPAEVDISGISVTGFRVVVVSADQTKSAIETISGFTGNTINLTNPLPGFVDAPAEVSTVRIESFSPRYSYFFTVRRSSPIVNPTVTVVVLFNRSFSLEDEEIYRANFGNNLYDDDTDVEETTLNSDQLKISFSDEGKAPLMREGNYVLDARQAIWYRIMNVNEDTTAETAILTLDRSVQIQTADTGTASDVGRAIFMPGIVEIYEL